MLMKEPFITVSKRKEILVVDDIPNNVRLLSTLLSEQSYEVRKALSGTQALASARAALPDLILLDIKMPVMDGYEVCAALKADPKTQEIPIIFISALDDVLDKVSAFSAGGADYITKPFQKEEVLVRIEHQLRLQDLQQKLKAQNEELARSNQELDQFAYVVSHDLQQPLQSIIGYAKIMALQTPSLEASTSQYLDKILDAGDRMQNFIKDLLSYAQVGQTTKALVPVDCNALLKKVLNNLDNALTENDASLSYSSLPTVLGNEVQLMQLFQNLINNAIKFHRPETPPSVTIDASLERNTCWVFGIHDNGIGMPRESLCQVFNAFQRAHTSGAYPGTGIGLATCKKIVESHGGNIWVESELGKGSSFYFKLRAG